MEIFIKHMEILEKVRNIIKNKFNSEAKYSEKYQHKGFQCLYAPAILIDSIYRKNGNYYPKVFLEKKIIEEIEIYCSKSDGE